MNGMTGVFPQTRPAPLPAASANASAPGGGDATDVTGELRSRTEEAQMRYFNTAKPRDLRYAERVHGGALAPPWEEVWTDDPTVSSDNRTSLIATEIENTIATQVQENVAQLLQNASKKRDGSLAPLTVKRVSRIRKRANKLLPRDTRTSRLSNMVIDLEESALHNMRNLVENCIRRGAAGAHKLGVVQQQLDPARYGFDMQVMGRSLRRDDLLFSSFGHYVGTLLAVHRHNKGNRSISITQKRSLENRAYHALRAVIMFLAELPRMVAVDTIGQPDGRTVFTVDGEPLIVVGRDGARVLYTDQEVTGGATLRIMRDNNGYDSGSSAGDSSGDNASDGSTRRPPQKSRRGEQTIAGAIAKNRAAS